MDNALSSSDPSVEGLVGSFTTLQVSKEFTGTKPLPKKEHGNHKVCSASPDTSERHANFCASSADDLKVLSKPPPKLQRDSVGISKECKSEIVCSAMVRKSLKGDKENILPTTKVTTLVFFDLETTGLAFEIGASNVQIAEVSMVAINKKDFDRSTFEDFRNIRIIQKLCLCTRPRSMVSPTAAAINGLNNENLMDQNPFDINTALAVNFFLSHLPKPVCLLAHNGNSYDFPLLKAEFSRLNMSLPPDILIADTLKAFRAIGVPVFPPEKKICKSVKFTKKGQVSCSLSNLYLYFFSENPDGSHSSEGDCNALAKVCHQVKDSMLLWIDENCTNFDSVSPMW